MNNLENKLKDYFSLKMHELYDVTSSMARFLFERWNTSKLTSENAIKSFVASQEVRKVFFINEEINIAKAYSKDELNKLGISLNEIDAEKHLYTDSKYQFTWEEVFHGPSDSYINLYKVIEPKPDDSHLT